MCDLCDESADGVCYCPECGRIICYDTEGIDDICAPASGTDTGDLACLPCAIRINRENEELEDLEWGGLWEDYPGGLITGNEPEGEDESQ